MGRRFVGDHASRGAPRMPLPMRSAKRAPALRRSGGEREQRFGQAAAAVTGEDPRLAPAASGRSTADASVANDAEGFAIPRLPQREHWKAERDGDE